MTTSIRTAALAIVAVLVCACGPGAKEKAVRTTLVSVNAAREAMLVWDDRTQDAIIEHATDEVTGQAELEKHRDKRDELVALFEASYYAIAIAATDTSDLHVADMFTAVAKLYSAYKVVVGTDPPAPKGK